VSRQAPIRLALAEAAGQPIGTVFSIVDDSTRQAAEHPIDRVMREGTVLAVARDTLLVGRSGREIPIEGNGAPLITPDRALTGAVLVFHDTGAERAAAAQFRAIARLGSRADSAVRARRAGHIFR
jgi:hypothetical protein